MEWVEASGSSVDVAVQAAIAELGIEPDQADVEILQEPKPGFLGLGGQEAIVKVVKKKRKSTSRKGQGKSDRNQSEKSGGNGSQQQKTRSGGGRKKKKVSSEGRQKGSGSKRASKKDDGRKKREESSVSAPDVSIEEQAEMAKGFLEGLLEAFGLEGKVETRIEDDILFIDVTGGQTEALVGPKGSIMQAVHELTRTVIQRKTYRAPRMRLDIAGYAERRRAALKIFAGQVAEKVLENGGEMMLEPMNPADRKVLHDAVAEIEGVRSFSEGRDPKRSVVIAPAENDGD